MPAVFDPWVRRASLISVTDGDTYRLRVDLGYYVSTVQAIRLKGVNTAELNTAEGKGIRLRVGDWFLEHSHCVPLSGIEWPLLVRSYKDKQTFARFVGEVYCHEGHSLAEWLVAEGYAEKVTP